MTSLLFYGDPHGEWRPLRESLQSHSPEAVILLGDCDLNRALSDELGDRLPSPERLFFILGNHESDRQCFYDNLLSAAPSTNCGPAMGHGADLRGKCMMKRKNASVTPVQMHRLGRRTCLAADGEAGVGRKRWVDT